jgi:hypothetical protein
MRQQAQGLTAARNHSTLNKLGGSPGSPGRGTVVTTDDLDARQRVEVGRAAQGQQAVWWVITNMIVQVTKGVVPGQEATEKESDKTARMDGWGLGAVQHPDTTQEGGPEKLE